jgi:hypothetical protein
MSAPRAPSSHYGVVTSKVVFVTSEKKIILRLEMKTLFYYHRKNRSYK